ncbi:MAG TPA: hypothetical protein VHO68_01425, partial [Bacteroidales bacterium]|nr:hypothetical protein [Bacteroidales bacterium]
MKERTELPKNFMIAAIVLAVIGLVSFIAGINSTPDSTWGAYLVAAYYFLSLSIGAAFFLSIQSISQSGWSSAFKRVPEAMVAWMPWAALTFFVIWFGMNNLYQWTHEDALANDAMIQHKSVYLNVPFFFIRMLLFFALW